MRKSLVVLMISALLIVALLSGSVMARDKIKVGFSMDNLRLERWIGDRDNFVKAAEALGMEVIVQSANSDDALQLSQAQNMLTQGIDVLMVLPHNGKVMGSIVEEAHASGVPVIAYCRPLMNSDVDYYIAFDNFKIGQMQAQYVVDQQPEGNFVLMGGSQTDNNAHVYRAGQLSVIQPYIDSGDIKIVNDQWAKDWLPQEALKIVENALTANNNEIDAVVASNDSTAGGAIEALAGQGLAGKTPVSGQDATLSAMQRVVEGTQTMTVYKPTHVLATTAAYMVYSVANDLPVLTNSSIDNGSKDVPTYYLKPIAVSKDNTVDTVIKDGYHKMEDVYKNVPRSEWPENPYK